MRCIEQDVSACCRNGSETGRAGCRLPRYAARDDVFVASKPAKTSVAFFMPLQVLHSPAQRQGAILRRRRGGD